MYLAFRWYKEDSSRFEILYSGWRRFVIRQVNENVINIRLDNKTAILKLIYARASTSGFISHSLTPTESFQFCLPIKLHHLKLIFASKLKLDWDFKKKLSIFSTFAQFFLLIIYTQKMNCVECVILTPQTVAVRVNVYFL